MSGVLTDAEAIAAVRTALQRYGTEAESTAKLAADEMNQVRVLVDDFITLCDREIQKLEQALEALYRRDPPDLDRAATREQELRLWQRRHADALSQSRLLAQAHDRFRGQQTRFTQAVTELVQRGASRMRQAREDVINYERQQHIRGIGPRRNWSAMPTNSSGTAGGSFHSAGVPGASSGFDYGSSDSSDYGSSPDFGGDPDSPTSAASSPPSARELRSGVFTSTGNIQIDGLPGGTVLVPLTATVDDGRINGPRDFGGKGVDFDDLQWAIGAFYAQVLPRVHGGGDVMGHLQDSDAGRGNTSPRTLVETYRGFLGDSGIRLSALPGGRYDVINGAHRIYAARQLGITHLPAQIVNPS